MAEYDYSKVTELYKDFERRGYKSIADEAMREIAEKYNEKNERGEYIQSAPPEEIKANMVNKLKEHQEKIRKGNVGNGLESKMQESKSPFASLVERIGDMVSIPYFGPVAVGTAAALLLGFPPYYIP